LLLLLLSRRRPRAGTAALLLLLRFPICVQSNKRKLAIMRMSGKIALSWL
jgi:hypothetical protein